MEKVIESQSHPLDAVYPIAYLDCIVVKIRQVKYAINKSVSLALGVNDILIACVDGLKSFPDTINTVFPETQIQLCIAYMVRNSMKYVREVIDRVRVDQANQLKHDKLARKRVKRDSWVLLKNRSNLTEKQAGYLDELLESNKELMLVSLLREQLKEMGYCEDERQAKAQCCGGNRS